jgi:hypothetical protein
VRNVSDAVLVVETVSFGIVATHCPLISASSIPLDFGWSCTGAGRESVSLHGDVNVDNEEGKSGSERVDGEMA